MNKKQLISISLISFLLIVSSVFAQPQEKEYSGNSWWEYLKTCNRRFWAAGDLNNDGKEEQVGIFSQWEGEGWWSEDTGDVICIFDNQNILYGDEIARYSTVKNLSIKDIDVDGVKEAEVFCEFTEDFPEKNVTYVYKWDGKEYVKEKLKDE